MLRRQKQHVITTLHNTLQDASVVMMVRNKGWTVAESNDLRQRMRDVGSRLHVAKNRLSRRAIKNTKFENLENFFRGPTAIVTIAQDPIATIKIATSYAKENPKFEIINASFGTYMLDSAGVQVLTHLPSLEVLRTNLIELLTRPSRTLVRIVQHPARHTFDLLKTPGSQLVTVLSAYAKQKEK